MLHIEIDAGSGFCFGVTTAIKKAEEELGQRDILYCLGDIVHNSRECERLRERGLVIIDHETFATLRDVRVLLRAHGEPPPSSTPPVPSCSICNSASAAFITKWKIRKS